MRKIRTAPLAAALALAGCGAMAEPRGADVYANGSYEGRTPVDVEVPGFRDGPGPMVTSRTITITPDAPSGDAALPRIWADRAWPDRDDIPLPRP